MNAAYLEAGEWWGISEIAQHLGGLSHSTVRDYIADPARGFPKDEAKGELRIVGGRKLYRADAVRAWHAARPGQGTRTDLRDQPDA